jgi:membrane-associated phospholipid phosphatase
MAMDVANHTYFLSQLGVSSAFLLWAYLRRAEHFERVRNAFLAVNVVSVAVLFAYPLAPPRLVPGSGFADTMSSNAVNLHSAVVDALNNPYSAMPSLHASYALVLGIAGVTLTRSLWAKLLWAIYPVLITFCIVASGNHFVLDAIAGFAALAVIPAADRARAAVTGWLGVRRAAAQPRSIQGETAA